jgi:VWFA-related protein
MTRRSLPVVLIAIAVSALMHAQDPAGTAPSDRLLQIQAVALDRKGNPVTDLKREDVEVWINGYRVPIQTLVPVTPATEERAGRLIVLLLDNITIDPRMVLRVREVARRFVTRMLPEDRMAVVLLNGDAVEITSDSSRLLRRIESYNQTGGFVPDAHIGAQVLTTIAALSRDVSEAAERRKAIVAIGSGWLLDAPIPPPQVGAEVRREWIDAVRAMAIADVNFYVIDPGGVGISRVGTGKHGFASDAGGQAFINTNDLNGAVDQILREGQNYYVINVADPPVGRTAPVRELDVRSLRKGITVRARRAIPGGGTR